MMKASRSAVANNRGKEIKEAELTLDKAIEASKAEVIIQREKYMEYLVKKCEKTEFPFYHDMLAKLIAMVALTPSMEVAVAKSIVRDAEFEANRNKPVDESKCPTITLKMKAWWCQQNKLESRVITGVVLIETAKAYKMKGYADMIEGTFCMRCGRELTEPASMVIGFGAECCAKLGIPYPSDVKTASKKERLAIRKQLLKVLHNQKFEAWVPKSQVAEVVEGALIHA